MKKLPIAVFSAILLFSISCKEDETTDETMDECTECCDGDCFSPDPGEIFATLVTGAPSTVTLGDEVRDEWGDMDITVTYDGISGGTIEVEGVPEGAEDVWHSGDFTFNADQTSFTINGGNNRTASISESKVVISFRIDPSSRLSAFELDWVFVWGE